MSFEVFVQCFKDGEFAGVSRQRIRDAFGPFLNESDPLNWQIYYDEQNYCDVTLTLDDSDRKLLCGFTVGRPCGDERLWNALASILKLGNVVLYFPGGCPLIGDSRVAQHLPLDMIEVLGQPKCVATGREILHELQSG